MIIIHSRENIALGQVYINAFKWRRWFLPNINPYNSFFYLYDNLLMRFKIRRIRYKRARKVSCQFKIIVLLSFLSLFMFKKIIKFRKTKNNMIFHVHYRQCDDQNTNDQISYRMLLSPLSIFENSNKTLE